MKNLVLATLVGFGLILGGCDKKNDLPQEKKEVEHKNSVQPASDIVTVDTKSAKPESNWIYESKDDEMRGITSKYAMILSDNQAYFDFPYDGGSNLKITIRKRSNEPAEIMFVISKGQYSCDTISDNCFTTIKFDDGSVENIELSSTTDHSSDVLFIAYNEDSDRFIKSLLKSKKLIVELPFYQEGKKQFKFTTSGLKWSDQSTLKSKSNKIKAKNTNNSEVDVITQSAQDAADQAVAAVEHATGQ